MRQDQKEGDGMASKREELHRQYRIGSPSDFLEFSRQKLLKEDLRYELGLRKAPAGYGERKEREKAAALQEYLAKELRKR